MPRTPGKSSIPSSPRWPWLVVLLAPHAAVAQNGAVTAPPSLEVAAWVALDAPVFYPGGLSAGDRLVIEAEGDVGGYRPDAAGGLAPGALVASFDGGIPFLIAYPGGRAAGSRGSARTRLLWTAPAAGRLAFAVEQDPFRRLSGGYSLRILPLGPRGDPRQRQFPPPSIAFLPRTESGPLLAVRYEDRAGFGLDRKTLRVILDTEAGDRIVLSPYFRVGSAGAELPALPPGVRLPSGVHRVGATIGDALGNVSPPAEIFLDEP